uniref:hypothetical protein n=1 Tax=Ornithobacterium rhinotracheale TaxID=28251 RepID=UPI0039A60BD9
MLSSFVELHNSTDFAPKKPNILFICVDDLRPELNVFGAKYIHSPHHGGRGKSFSPPAGMGGEGWNAPNVIEMPNAWDKQLLPFTEWKHPRGIMHGLVDNLKLVLLKKADPKL